jgi:hypothetical protein
LPAGFFNARYLACWGGRHIHHTFLVQILFAKKTLIDKNLNK